MKYRIEHVTRYEYGQEVLASHHVARLTPLANREQTPLHFDVRIDPRPVEIVSGRDYFGNEVLRFALQEPHEILEVTSDSTVLVNGDGNGESIVSPEWEKVRAEVKAATTPEALAAYEFAFASPAIPVASEFAAYAERFFPEKRPFLEAVRELTRQIHEDFAFDSTATTVSTPVGTVLRQKKGVCQDFAHFQIACLRSLGLPARYVSGYIRTEPPPGQPRLQGADATHAWVSVFCPGLGWTEFDPTNDVMPSDSHVRVAHGRDYGDISPLRGTVVGGGGQKLTIGVTMTPLDEKGIGVGTTH